MSRESLQRANRAKHEKALERDRKHEPFLRENAMQGSGWLAEKLNMKVWKVRKMMDRLQIKLRSKRGPAPGRGRFWNGGRIKDKDGYILIYSPDHPHRTATGYVREHRLVMEKKLGRYLTEKEVVDHWNEKKDDNDIGNLRLYSNNGDHISDYWNGRKHKPETIQKMKASAVRRWNLQRAKQTAVSTQTETGDRD